MCPIIWQHPYLIWTLVIGVKTSEGKSRKRIEFLCGLQSPVSLTIFEWSTVPPTSVLCLTHWHCWNSTGKGSENTSSLFSLFKWVLCKTTYHIFIKCFCMIHSHRLNIHLAIGRNIKFKVRNLSIPTEKEGDEGQTERRMKQLALGDQCSCWSVGCSLLLAWSFNRACGFREEYQTFRHPLHWCS